MAFIEYKEISKNLYIINKKYYILVRDDACKSCVLRGKNDCLMHNEEPDDCQNIIGDNKFNRKCFKEFTGGV